MKCEVCGISDSKYRCPTCMIRYCSKDCFGNHKSDCSKKLSEPSSKEPKSEEATVLLGPTKSIYYQVPEEKLEMLRDSKPLEYLLKNPHLRNLLKTIEESPNPENIMDKMMQEPLFTEYVDVCMETLDIESS